jgi:hypothetical protein
MTMSLIGGLSSLSHTGVMSMWRNGQFEEFVPSFGLSGIIEPTVNMPDSLQFMSMLLSRQTSAEHDSQVTVQESKCQSIHLRNERTDAFSFSGIDGAVQRCNHWSPLEKESQLVSTRRDREKFIFDSPKDRHIEPWVEMIVRFFL